MVITIPDKKLTDNEIIKALERLKNTKDYLKEQYQEQVKNCPYPELKPIAKQTYEDNKKAFDIAIKVIEEFNRQKAEIERLNKTLIFEINSAFERGKSEAYKEFAERLKACQYTQSDICGYQSTVIDVESINNLLKEMEGEANAPRA